MSQHPKPKWGDALSPDRVDRIWTRVEGALEGKVEHMSQVRRAPRRSSSLAYAFAAMAAVAALVLFAVLRRDPQPRAADALRVPAGGAFESETKLSDGSVLMPSPGTRVEVLRSTNAEFATLQRRGRCRYSVTPGGPRKWTIETDLATVEVLGTIFTVDRSEEGLTVSVERGRVFVRGGSRAETLGPGESFYVDAARAASPRSAGADSGAVEASHDEAPVGPDTVTPARAIAANHLAASAEEVLLIAARQPPAKAAEELERWLTLAPRDASWSVVALRLATLLQDAGRCHEAIRWFEGIVSLGVPAAAVEDAAAHRVLCLAALGRTTEASAAARDHKRRWPQSTWSSAFPDGIGVER